MPDQNQFLRALSPALYDKLQSRLRTRHVAAGDVLFRAGEKIGSVWFCHSGAVSLVMELAHGEMIECALIGRDSVVGGGAALDDCDALSKAIIQVSGSVSALDVDTARQLARDSEEFRTAIVRHEQIILAQSQQSAACNAAHGLLERLARWLLRVRDVTGSESLALTQEFIAEMLGVRRTSVSLVAHQLQAGGLISCKRGRISIDNLSGLQDAACECYGAVKAHYDRLLQSQGPRPRHGASHGA